MAGQPQQQRLDRAVKKATHVHNAVLVVHPEVAGRYRRLQALAALPRAVVEAAGENEASRGAQQQSCGLQLLTALGQCNLSVWSSGRPQVQAHIQTAARAADARPTQRMHCTHSGMRSHANQPYALHPPTHVRARANQSYISSLMSNGSPWWSASLLVMWSSSTGHLWQEGTETGCWTAQMCHLGSTKGVVISHVIKQHRPPAAGGSRPKHI